VEVGMVVAALAAHLHLGQVQDEVADGGGDDSTAPGDVAAEVCKPAGYADCGIHLHGAADYVGDQPRQVDGLAVVPHGERDAHLAVTMAGDVALADAGLPDACVAVGELGFGAPTVGE